MIVRTGRLAESAALRWPAWILLASGLMILSAWAVESPAQDNAPQAAEIEAELAESLDDSSWYDNESQQLRPVVVRERVEDTGNRDSRWLPKPDKVRQPGTAAPAGGGATGTGGLFGGGTMGNIVGWTMMAIAAFGIVALLVYFFSKADMEVELGQRGRRGRSDNALDEDLTARMEHLPEEVRQQGTDMRGAAERSMRAGDFQRAIICLFAHQLLQLDRHQVLRLTRGKTNRQYVREAHADGKSGDILQHTVDSFEASYFGRHALSTERFAFLWKENERLEQILRQHREAAA